MALANMGFKRPKLVSFGGRRANREGEKEMRRGRGRRRGEEKGGINSKRYGTLDFVWITWNCKLYMIKCLSPNLGF